MRRSLLILLLFIGKFASAQQYNNEWIDYSRTYYKFKIAQTGLYRINQPALPVSLNNIPAEQFQLWRNGKQVTIHTSVSSGALGTSGFIEFWGEKNDGVADKPLYLDPTYQLSDRISLETDTAAYFLTVNANTANNSRYETVSNPVAGNSLPAQEFLIYTAKYDFREIINRGHFINLGVNVYSSSYDYGEWWSSSEINPANPRTITFSNLSPAATGPNASLKISAAATSIDPQKSIRVSVNSNVVIDTVFTSDAAAIINRQGSMNVNRSILTNNTQVQISNQSANATNRFVAGFIELTYPRTWDFNNQSSFEFSLPATGAVYIEITNFNAGSSAPVLYDRTNNRRYVADVAAGKYRFVLPADAARNFVLVSQTSGINSVTQLQSKTFVNYAASANQGDYLIITHNSLRTSGDPVDQYRSYRSSSAGGSYNAKIYDIDELTDQFAFGIRKHPLSIKNFLRFARNTYSTTPKMAFLVGRGVTYEEYAYHQTDPEADKLNLVPTFGYPGSDILLASSNLDPVPATPVGRLAAITPQEVSLYLAKISQYEAAQVNLSQTIAEKQWMKNVIHVAGANDPGLDGLITLSLNGYKTVITDTSYGAKVYDFSKATTGPATGITDALLRNLLRDGVGLLTYFGHGSSTILDYNLPDVNTWNNQGKYPLFLMLGCNVGNFFSYDESRLSVKQTLTEKYVLTPQLGGIGLIASTHFGTYNDLDDYAKAFYTAIGRTQYNKPIAIAMQETAQQLAPSIGGSFLRRVHLEQHLMHGDPALKPNTFPKPDFIIEEPQVIINPSFISVADTVFNVKAYFRNLGKAVGNANSAIGIEVKRRYPDGTTAVVLTQSIIPALRNIDSISFNLPIIPTRDKGENKLIVTIDYAGQYDELSESNNSTEKTFFIFEDELRPIYPYNFAIINRNNAKLVASTADPLLGVRTYMMEMDTTELFNSPSKITRTITSAGGVIEFDPQITYQDSLVYYWRVAITPITGVPHWNTSSFVYLNGTNLGFNQSHFYQHTKSIQNRLYIDSADRKWKFALGSTSLTIRNRVYRTGAGMGDSEFSININGLTPIYSACVGNSLIFNVFDPVSMKPWYNQTTPSTIQSGSPGGYMGSGPVCTAGRQYNFEWSYTTIAERRKMRDFLDNLPNDVVVTVRTINNTDVPAPFINEWKNDASTDGTGNTLYDRLLSAGFADIDSFSYLRSWAFIYKKGSSSLTPKWEFTQNEFDDFAMDILVPSIDTLGYITSPKFGPAAAWQEVKWRGSSLESPSTDNYTVGVVGIRTSGQEDLLYTLNSTQQDFNISSVSATTYPYIRLVMFTEDKANLTPYQLRWWRLYYTPVPEGGLAANLKFNFRDTLEAGEPLLIAIPFKNVSDVNFANTIKVNVAVRDRNNQQTVITVPRLKAVVPGDTAMFTYQLNTQSFVGLNTLSVDVNPDNDQPEHAHFNNFFYKTFFVKGDVYKPTLDVTFDGVRILNRDIVSAKPRILVKLKDESKFLALDDTSLVTIMLKYPDNSVRRFRFGTDTLKFTPGTAGVNNEATVEFTPTLADANNETEYELIVIGKDKSGNTAGNLEYRVLFQVYNTPMISNMFNYPNPFTTSTAFVFTLTGSMVPQNLKIQILTVTGKIVREITKDELGPLNIGRNITSFKWDGTDQYGQKLGNGVYLYRVVTNLNGNKLDKFSLDGNGNKDNTDKYFNKGYGKMYLMR